MRSVLVSCLLFSVVLATKESYSQIRFPTAKSTVECERHCDALRACDEWRFEEDRGCVTIVSAHVMTMMMKDAGELQLLQLDQNCTEQWHDDVCGWQMGTDMFGGCHFDRPGGPTQCMAYCSEGCGYFNDGCTASCQPIVEIELVFTPSNLLLLAIPAIPAGFLDTIKTEVAALLQIDEAQIVDMSAEENGDGSITVYLSIVPGPGPPTTVIAQVFEGDVLGLVRVRDDLPTLQRLEHLVCHNGCSGKMDPFNPICSLENNDASRICGTDNSSLAYTYSPETDTCDSFIFYGPCPGFNPLGKNIFPDAFECFKHCPYRQEMKSPRIPGCSFDLNQGTTCPAPTPAPAADFAVSQRFYFDPSTETCTSFQYEGCNGNDNNFPFAYECELGCDSPLSLDCHVDVWGDIVEGNQRGGAQYTATDPSVTPCRYLYYNALKTHSTMWPFDCYGDLDDARSTCEGNDGRFCQIDVTVRLHEFTEIACFPITCDTDRDVEFLLLRIIEVIQTEFDEYDLSIATDCGTSNAPIQRVERLRRPPPPKGTVHLLQTTYADCMTEGEKLVGTKFAAFYGADDASECHMHCNEAGDTECVEWHIELSTNDCYLFSEVTSTSSDTDYVSGPRDCSCSADSDCPEDYSQCKSSVCKVCNQASDCPTCGSSADRKCDGGECECNECFSKSSSVYVENEGPVTLGDLEIGQKILALDNDGELFYDEVMHMSHTIPVTSSNKIVTLLHISHEFGSIDITADHLIYVSPENMPPSKHCILVGGAAQACTYVAGEIEVGSVIFVSTDLEGLRPTMVQSITHVQDNVRGVITMNGNVLVDGTLSSCYRNDHEFVHNRLQPIRETYQNLPWLFQKPIYFGVYMDAFVALWPTINTQESAGEARRFDVLAFGEHAWFVVKVSIALLVLRKFKKAIF